MAQGAVDLTKLSDEDLGIYEDLLKQKQSAAPAATPEPDYVEGVYGPQLNAKNPNAKKSGPITYRDKNGATFGLNIDPSKPAALVPGIISGHMRQQTVNSIVPSAGRERASELAGNFLGGIPQAVTGLPAAIGGAGSALLQMLTGGGTAKAQDLIGGAVRPAVTIAQNAGAAVAPSLVNQATEEQTNQAATAAGQTVGGIALSGLMKAASPTNIRTALNSVTTPEARLTAAANARSNIAPASQTVGNTLRAVGNVNPLDAVSSGAKAVADLVRRGSAPANEAIAKFMAGPPSALSAGGFPLDEDMLPKGQIPPRYSKNEANTSIPQYADDLHPLNSGYEAPPQGPPPTTPKFIMDDIRAQGEVPKPQLDAPTLNKWIGAKASNMMRGADPGARLISESLVGADKASTLKNVQSALGSASSDLQSSLESAGQTGKIINAKSVIDDSIADATKRFGVKSDEAFMKQVEQVSTDAASEFDDLPSMSPLRAQELKVRIGESINWTSKLPNPFNDLLKKVYRGLNDGIGDVGGDVRTAQLRWGDLFQASKALSESIVKDKAGRGTGAALPQLKVPSSIPRVVK